jgi:hypothetical protein
MKRASDRSGPGFTILSVLVVASIAIVAAAGCSRRGESGAATASAGPPSADEWRVEWVDVAVPETMTRGAVQQIRAAFRNAGTHGMATDRLSISYHWYVPSPAGPVQVVWDGVRTPITSVVEPGATYSTTMQVQPPTQAGDYLFVVDLVRDGVSWFQFKGAPQSIHPIKIL